MHSVSASSSILSPPKAALDQRYREVRSLSETLCDSLEIEDYVIQTMPDVSPTRWHLAHTTWFFETFVLTRAISDYQPANPAFEFLFNSYYNSVGRQFPRAHRGWLSRPTVREVFVYRKTVDEWMLDLLKQESQLGPLRAIVEIGLHHEQQHQELMLTDIKHVFSQNPLQPAYLPRDFESPVAPNLPLDWQEFAGGMTAVGHDSEAFAYDNESPRFRTFLQPYALANRLTTNAEFAEFIEDGGYTRPELWLSLGWATVQAEGWTAPLYWTQCDGQWHEFTLRGTRPLRGSEPVTHLSYFEADAYARWAQARLPTEFEWEAASAVAATAGNFVDDRQFHPRPAGATCSAKGGADLAVDTSANNLVGVMTELISESQSNGNVNSAGHNDRPLQQMFGDVWEWTASPYTAYPGYQPAAGAIGEYNGKFMCNQYVLRGGSCATSANHIRPTYRNFFPPEARWQFSGLRLAR